MSFWLVLIQLQHCLLAWGAAGSEMQMAGIKKDSHGGWRAGEHDVEEEEKGGGIGLGNEKMEEEEEEEWEEEDVGVNCQVSSAWAHGKSFSLWLVVYLIHFYQSFNRIFITLQQKYLLSGSVPLLINISDSVLLHAE